MIPEIDVRGNVAKKIWEGSLAFEFEGEEDLLEIPFVKFAGPVRAEFTWNILEDNSVVLAGNVAFTLEGSCSRCLEPARKDVVFETEGEFAEGEGDGEVYGFRGGKLRLEDFLRDTLMLAMPSRLLCETCEQWEKEE